MRAANSRIDAQRIVVAGNGEVDFFRVAVGVDDADDRNLQLARFVDRDLFLARVDDEQRVGQPAHVADAFEVLLQLALFFFGARDFLLRHELVAAVGGHRFEIAQPRDAALNRREVGEQAAEPALVDVIHPGARRFFRDDVLRLPLGADEQHGLAFGRQLTDEILRLLEQLDGLAQVDDVDAGTLAKDERLHLGVPALGLVAEVDACFEQVFHRERGQATSMTHYRLLNWNRFRAPAMPYFLRSFARASRVSKPFFLQPRPVLGVQLDERAGDAETNGARLSGDAAAGHRAEHVELVGVFGQLQRLDHLHPQRFGGEVVGELALVDGDGAGAGPEEDARRRFLAAPGSVKLSYSQSYATSYAVGCCAACG